MPPRAPKNSPPIARLTLVSQTNSTVVVSTSGSVAGFIGQGRNRTPSTLVAWVMYWGDTKQDSGSGPPPVSISHTYASSLTTAFLRLVVTDQTTLTAQATLTVNNLGSPFLAPANLTATPLSAVSIQLSWESVTGATSYSIERALHGSIAYDVIGTTVNGSTLSFVDTGLLGQTAYDYRVRALNDTGASPYSNIASATTFAPSLPAAPTNLIATPASTSSITLSWTDNASDELGFQIERLGTQGQFVSLATVAANVVTFTDAGLTDATAYTYRVRAFNAGGNTAYTNQATATTDLAVPAAPTNLAGVPQSPTSILVSWSAALKADSYSLERSLHNINVWSVIAAPTALFFLDTGVVASTSFDYRVRGFNASGFGAYSTIASATTPAAPPPPTPPNAPTTLLATAVSTTQINLTWIDNSTNETSFEVEQLVSGSFSRIATLAANTTAYSVTGLIQSTFYTFRVRATNGTGASAYTNQASATTQLAVPAAPTNVLATPLSDTAIRVNWTAVVNATGYSIERSAHNAGVYTVIATPQTPTVTFTDTGRTASTSYDYRMRASNAAGFSAYSAIASATTFNAPAPPPAPNAPSALVATAISSTQINLAWTDNSTDESNFEIQMRVGAASYTTISTVAAGVVAYSVTGLTPSTTYTFHVRATNAGGASAYSNESTATTQAPPPPAAPSAPTTMVATAQSDTTIQLTWVDTSGTETGMSLERQVSGGGFTVRATLPANTTSYLDQNLAGSTLYGYRVRAFNAGGNSAYSNTASATTFATPPPPPPPPPPNLPTRLLQAADLTYLGALRVPLESSGVSYTYPGRGLAYNVANDSLFITAYGGVALAELQCRAPSLDLSNVPICNTLQPPTVNANFNTAFNNVLVGGGTYVDTAGVAIGGYLVLNATTLIGANYAVYDASSLADRSHWDMSTTLSNAASFHGMFKVGSLNPGFYAGYLGAIPTEWQSSLGGTVITGGCGFSITSRTSQGPAAFTYDPVAHTTIPLVYYPIDHSTLGEWSGTVPNSTYNSTMTAVGVVFPPNTATVIFLGTIGTGTPCYGNGGLVDQSGGTEAFCYDPDFTAKSQHAWPYRNQAWLYDAHDFLRVRAGTINPWDVVPYAIVDLGPLGVPVGNGGAAGVGLNGATCDIARRRIYIAQTRGEILLPNNPYGPENSRPLIRVIEWSDPSLPPPSPPAAPSGLTATATSQTQVVLNWVDNSTNETGFQVERKLTTGGTFALITTVLAGVTTFSDSGLIASTSYTYRVRATNASGNSAYSNQVVVTTQATPPPPPAFGTTPAITCT